LNHLIFSTKLDDLILENVIRNLGEPLSPSKTEEFIQSIPFDHEGNATYDYLKKVIYNQSNKKLYVLFSINIKSIKFKIEF